MNQYKIFVQQIGLLGITNLFLSLSSIIFLPILTKNLSIEDYGIWTQLMTTVGMVPLAVLFGFPYAMTRFLPALEKKEEIQEVFYSIFFVVIAASVITSFLIFIFSGTVATMLFDGNIRITKVTCVILFIECLNNLFFNYFRATGQIKKYSILLFIQTLLNLILVIFFVVIEKDILGAVVGFTLKGIIILIITFTLIVLEIGFKIPKFLNLNSYLVFGLPTVPSNFSSWIVNSSDRYIIGIILGTAFVGYYSPGYALGNIINMFFSPVFFLLPVTLSKYYDNSNYDEVSKIFSYTIKYCMLVAIPSAFGLSVLSKTLLMVLTTPEIASQGYLITPFTALSSLLYGMYGIVSHVCILEKKTIILGKIWLISATINIILNLIFIPYMGILGAAITTLIAFLYSLIATLQYCSKLFVFEMQVGFIVKSIFSSCLMSLLIIEIKPEGFSNIVLTILIAAIFYGTIMIFLKGFEKRELNFFKSIIKT